MAGLYTTEMASPQSAGMEIGDSTYLMDPFDFGNVTDRPTDGAIVKGAIPNGIILSIVGFLGVLGNATLLILIVIYPKLRTVPNLLIINLTLGDLLYILVSFPVFVFHELYPYWYSSLAMCKGTNYCQAVGLGVCVYSIMGLSMERYIAIVKGLEMRSSRTTRRAVLSIAAIWTVSLIIPIPILVMAMKPIPSLCFYIPHWDVPSRAFETCRFILMYAIPFVTILLLYSMIAKQLLLLPGESSTQNPLILARRRLAITVMVVAIFFGVSWLPYFAYKLWFEFKFIDYLFPPFEPPIWADYFRATHNYMAFINPCLNPWILIFISTAHRRALMKCICCGSNEKDEENSWRMTNVARNSTRRTGNSYVSNDNNWAKDHKKLSESLA